jgi:hypothetical protein
MKMWEEEETEKERIHERLQKICDIMIDFYGEEIINETMIFYQSLRFNGVVDNFSDEDVDMQ